MEGKSRPPGAARPEACLPARTALPGPVKSQGWGPFRDKAPVVHSPGAFRRVVVEGSVCNPGCDPHACAERKCLIRKAVPDLSTAVRGPYQYDQFEKGHLENNNRTRRFFRKEARQRVQAAQGPVAPCGTEPAVALPGPQAARGGRRTVREGWGCRARRDREETALPAFGKAATRTRIRVDRRGVPPGDDRQGGRSGPLPRPDRQPRVRRRRRAPGRRREWSPGWWRAGPSSRARARRCRGRLR